MPSRRRRARLSVSPWTVMRKGERGRRGESAVDVGRAVPRESVRSLSGVCQRESRQAEQEGSGPGGEISRMPAASEKREKRRGRPRPPSRPPETQQGVQLKAQQKHWPYRKYDSSGPGLPASMLDVAEGRWEDAVVDAGDGGARGAMGEDTSEGVRGRRWPAVVRSRALVGRGWPW
ncbi:hypothetical protein MGYG_08032 [Nannizzia gypsea CBS 118893]|uniref:Uncharacterized protein n=1 Tax=Arthroderma gypseum (strain ATCC MYA-4604 / CBS 118893) TaxID=535722 RepID=E4V4V3_ARTGP|nr:hypothetical protein MGYG_08032 [Nannizzia gypsea CBS 118893]EFR05027.1 hypothetical protein MGYG_08032 [Nannizzia gypsea CBS 118893]